MIRIHIITSVALLDASNSELVAHYGGDPGNNNFTRALTTDPDGIGPATHQALSGLFHEGMEEGILAFDGWMAKVCEAEWPILDLVEWMSDLDPALYFVDDEEG